MERKLIRAMKVVAQSITGVQPRSVFFTPHDTFMPTGTVMPAIGIKDGRLIRSEQAGGMWLEKYSVELVAWVDMTSDGEEALVGDNGILSLAEEIEKKFDRNNLGLFEVIYSWPAAKTPSQFFPSQDSRWLVKKSVTIEYEVERDRP